MQTSRYLFWVAGLAILAIATVTSAAEYRSIDGMLNNPDHPEWGSRDTHLRRVGPAAYSDGLSQPSGLSRPGARLLSNLLSKQATSVQSKRGLTDMVWQWGQFLTHDTNLSEVAQPQELLNIPIPLGDPELDPSSLGTRTITFRRSVYDPATGTTDPRQQRNQVTSFIDASQVYGSDPARALAIRSLTGGRLNVSEGNFLPYNTLGFRNELVGTDPRFFLTGDIRANEQLGLMSLHTLFVREHNRLAAEIQSAQPSLSDEELYQRARRTVIAEMQAVTFNEFLPALLGRTLPMSRGYNPQLQPSISQEFAVAGFRLHSMVSDRLLRLNNDSSPITAGSITLRDATRVPEKLVETGIDPILKGLTVQIQQEGDLLAVDPIRTILFGPPGSPGTDIIALDIQRGRDHGLSDYNTMRAAYGLSRVARFSDITKNTDVAGKLQTLYGSVDAIDPFVGMFAEDPVIGGSVGPLVHAILVEQFLHLRDGDRFWYERSFSPLELMQIRQTRLSDIIKRNTNLTSLPRDVFRNLTSSLRGRVAPYLP